MIICNCLLNSFILVNFSFYSVLKTRFHLIRKHVYEFRPYSCVVCGSFLIMFTACSKSQCWNELLQSLLIGHQSEMLFCSDEMLSVFFSFFFNEFIFWFNINIFIYYTIFYWGKKINKYGIGLISYIYRLKSCAR